MPIEILGPCLAIAIGAVPGAILRYFLTEWCKRTLGQKFPYGTFLINLTGCLLMGLIASFMTAIKGLPVELGLSMTTGFLGSYTTFSTYKFEVWTLTKKNRLKVAGLYAISSVILGWLCVAIGIFLAQLILGIVQPHVL